MGRPLFVLFCCFLFDQPTNIGAARVALNISKELEDMEIEMEGEPIEVMQCGAQSSSSVAYTLAKTDQDQKVTTSTKNGKCFDWSMDFFQDGDLVQTVPVILRHFLKAGRNLNMGANCYGFATNQVGTGKGNPGGNTGPVNMPDLVTEENLLEAMEMEKAIYLGRDPTQVQLPLPVEPGRKYFLTVGFLKHMEFHFWGLMTTGWVAKPSKVGGIEKFHKAHGFYGDCDPGKSGRRSCCPSAGVFSKISKTGVGAPYRPDEGGFWLFPVTEGNNECK